MNLSRDEFLNNSLIKTELEKDIVARSYDTIMSNVYEQDRYMWGKYRLISPGKCCFKGVWNWDTAFHAIGTSRWDTELAKENILGFLSYQCESGMLPDVLREDGSIAKNSSKPPVFAWATEIVFGRDGDIEFLRAAYPSLVRHVEFWERERFHDGLFRYDAENKGSANYLKQIGFETGWDNSVRWDKGLKSLWQVDLNCYMVMEYRALASIARTLERFGEAVLWLEKEKRLVSLIKKKMWDPEKHIFNDVNFETGEISDILTPAIFMPLYIGIASGEQAEALARVAREHFEGRMPTVSFDDPKYSLNYWKGPTWLNVAFFAAKGLKDYGMPIADEIKRNILEMCYNEREGICENYDSKTGKGLCCKSFSWSSVFLIEFILGFDD